MERLSTVNGRVKEQDVIQLFESVSMEAIKQWLKAQGLPYSQKSRELFFVMLTGYVNEGKLTLGQLKKAMLDFEEHGAKEYFFFTIDSPFKGKRKEDFLAHLETIELWSDNEMVLASTLYSDERVRAGKTPDYLMVDYITWEDHKDGPHIRAKFSETHKHLSFNPVTGVVTEEERTKIIVLIHDVKTGFTQLRFDRPSDVHDHVDDKHRISKEAYQAYYRRMVNYILGVYVEGWEDLRRFMKNLAHTPPPESPPPPPPKYPGRPVPPTTGAREPDSEAGGPPPEPPAIKPAEAILKPPEVKLKELQKPGVFRMRYEEVRTGMNSIQSYTALNPKADIRGDRAHKGAANADGSTWLYRVIKGYWLPGTCGRYTLKRELFMGMNMREKKIWFAADCMPEEVNYALCRIKAIRKEVSPTRAAVPSAG